MNFVKKTLPSSKKFVCQEIIKLKKAEVAKVMLHFFMSKFISHIEK